MVASYAENPDVVFIGIDKQGPKSTVEGWIEAFGWTFPVGINDQENKIFVRYENSEFAYDRLYVIGRDRVISLEERLLRTSDFPRINEAILTAVGPVPVQPVTWSRIKAFYQ